MFQLIILKKSYLPNLTNNTTQNNKYTIPNKEYTFNETNENCCLGTTRK